MKDLIQLNKLLKVIKNNGQFLVIIRSFTIFVSENYFHVQIKPYENTPEKVYR